MRSSSIRFLRGARLAVGVVLGSVLAAPVPSARACSAPAPPPSDIARAYPPDGAVGVPTNVELTFEYVGLRWCEASLLPVDLVLRPAGSTDPAEEVPVTRTLLEQPTSWADATSIHVVRPDVELAPMTTYEIVGTNYPGPEAWECATATTAVLGTFTTGAGPDLVPPTLDSLAWDCSHREVRLELETCDCLDVTVTTLDLGGAASDDGDAAAIVFDVYKQSGDSAPLVPRWSSEQLQVLHPGDGYPANTSSVEATPGAFVVVAIDAAGNESAPVVVSSATVDCPAPGPLTTVEWCIPIGDPSSSRCSVDGAAGSHTPLPWLVALALLVPAMLRARRGRLA